MKKTWVIGDLHGHYKELLKLWEQLLSAGLNEKEDDVVFLGDYVDGGPDVKKLINWLMKKEKLYPHWVFLYGNHEDLMLDALVYGKIIYGDYYLWYRQGGESTLDSYVPKSLTRFERALVKAEDVIPKKHLDWLRSRPIFWENDNYIAVHAGLLPGLSWEDHKKILSGELAEPMNRKTLAQELIWTRDRFIGSSYDWGKKVIFGHTTFDQAFIASNKIGIDGMFHNHGKLIAIELPIEEIYYQESEE